MPILVGTNSYVSLSDAVAYMADRLYTDSWDAATDSQREKALLMAATALDSQNWRGTVTSEAQAMAWPRSGVVDREGREVASDSVPQAIADAECEMALALLRDDPASARDPSLRRLKVDSLEFEYRPGQRHQALSGAVLPLVKPFLADAGGSSARLVP